MGERRRKSRKRSDASSTSRQPEPVFLIDHNLGTHLVPEALRHAGATVEVLTDHFDSSTDDKTLLAAVGARGWVFLSKDRNIRRRTLERRALMNADVKAFLLAAADLSGDEQAAVLVKALPRIRRICGRPGPFIASITATGNVTVVEERPKRARARRRSGD